MIETFHNMHSDRILHIIITEWRIIMNFSINTIKHPCFSSNCGKYGRIHLPVSPYCNIACVFCDRSIHSNENRPGVSEKLLLPQDALNVIQRTLELSDNITVVGIAGIGDPLASEHALHTLRLIQSEYPNLIKCMSTNGLLLPYKIDNLVAVGLDTLTVTVNAMDPRTLAKLCDYIIIEGHKYYGVQGAKILIANQIEGITKIVKKGVLVKVNSVLVPGINDDQIPLIAKAVHKAGAVLHNIIPFIPCGKLRNYPSPTDEQINEARTESEKYIPVFKNCHHCRADAIGIPGENDIREFVYSQ